MSFQIKKFILALIVPVLVGALSGFLAGDSMASFAQLNKPVWAPPGWVFGPVWSILFVLMGISSYLVWTGEATDEKKEHALWLYGMQLVVNFFWSLIFFGGEWYFLAFLWLILLWILIWNTMTAFYEISNLAAYLMFPYLLWVTYAGVLNLAIALLN